MINLLRRIRKWWNRRRGKVDEYNAQDEFNGKNFML